MVELEPEPPKPSVKAVVLHMREDPSCAIDLTVGLLHALHFFILNVILF